VKIFSDFNNICYSPFRDADGGGEKNDSKRGEKKQTLIFFRSPQRKKGESKRRREKGRIDTTTLFPVHSFYDNQM